MRPSSDGHEVRAYNSHCPAALAQRAYLACISYVDYCLGVLFQALSKSKNADNTIIKLSRDHRWHRNENMKHGKTDRWEESDRVPKGFTVHLDPRIS